MLGVKVDDSSVQAGFRDVRDAGRRLEAVFRKLRQPMRRDQADHAREEAGPDGPWPARTTKARTRKMFAKVRRRKGQPAQAEVFRFTGLLGVLPDVIQVKAIGATVFARSPIKWAKAHADGDVVGRGSTLPARPFLYVSEKLGELATEMIGDHLEDAWDGGGRARTGV